MPHQPPVPHASPLLHVTLLEPEIPNNTGSVGRTCVATHTHLHLIHPLGFSLDEHAVRRAGLDYWPRLHLHEHPSWNDYLAAAAPPRLWLFTARAGRLYDHADFRPGDHLVFGRESVGLPATLLEAHADRRLVVPMAAGERSLNLSNVVCLAVYEALRQFRAAGLLTLQGHSIPPPPPPPPASPATPNPITPP